MGIETLKLLEEDIPGIEVVRKENYFSKPLEVQ